MSINTSKEINEKAFLLYKDLSNRKDEEEMTGKYVKSFRVYCFNEINKFFSEISEKSTFIDFHNTATKKDKYSKGIVKFVSSDLAFDLELICVNIHINIPLWFKKICIKYLSIQFEETDGFSNIRCTEIAWLWKSVESFEKTIKESRNESENALETVDRLTIISRFNLLSLENKLINDKIEFEGLIDFLKDDFDLYGWYLDCNIGGLDYSKDNTLLSVRFNNDRVYIYAAYLEVRQNHKPSEAYRIIQNSVHEANRKHLLKSIV